MPHQPLPDSDSESEADSEAPGQLLAAELIGKVPVQRGVSSQLPPPGQQQQEAHLRQVLIACGAQAGITRDCSRTASAVRFQAACGAV